MQAIYDALVRILRRDGWAGVTTRSVALETGIAVGTFYEYFPNKAALLSGYVRHRIEVLLERMDQEVVAAADLPWQDRIARLARMTADPAGAGLAPFERDIVWQEYDYAEPKHHRRAYEEMLKGWLRAVAACKDLPTPPDHVVEAAFVAVMGARRYALVVQPRHFDAATWLRDMERMCIRMFEPDPRA